MPLFRCSVAIPQITNHSRCVMHTIACKDCQENERCSKIVALCNVVLPRDCQPSSENYCAFAGCAEFASKAGSPAADVQGDLQNGETSARSCRVENAATLVTVDTVL